jgi:hypothetical protein
MRRKSLVSVFFLLFQLAPVNAHDVRLVPTSDKYPASNAAVKKYSELPAWKLETLWGDKKGKVEPKALRLVVPSPFAGEISLKGAVLPTEPQSSIYRFKYLDLPKLQKNPVPFQFVEVDWNTEGQKRGPNGSFITSHYDFHFYTKSGSYVDNKITCVTVDKTCDPQKTGYENMLRFLKLPAEKFVPKNTFTDTGSSIVAMGLHNLDGKFEFTVDSVNHNPVLIYGTFDGEIAFYEASITLYGFIDAAELAKQGKKSTWEIKQPEYYAYEWWPTTISLEYIPKQNVFYVELGGFKQHPVTPY